ncbi:MFS transporter [Planomonospora sp. ID91781]|uniref:MFS transporter n=1 Tax=Planomonospora sp. ID91781 TaxID=2738135 RepID=UPI0018C3F8AE|nr:MFS transporter [Planomonospora sp. ID91781]MBG0825901.1 MFS transporter [Planomonospora sp. ID91781]
MRPARRRRTGILTAVTCGAMGVVMADSIAATLALPALSSAAIGTGLPLGDLQWVTAAATVPYAALLATTGRLADAIGRSRMLLLGLIVFTLGALAAVASPTLPVLLAARAVQGIAAAMVVPASLALLLAEITPARRASAVGAWSAAAGVGGILLHSTGGHLVAAFGWRGLFAPSAMIGAVLIAACLVLPQRAPSRGRLPDLLGSIVLLAGMAMLVLAIAKGHAWGWRSGPTLALAAGGLMGLAAAIGRSLRHPAPAIEMTLWRRPGFALAGAISFLYGMTSFIVLAAIPLLLREIWALPVSRLSLMLVPISTGVLLASLAAGRLIRRYGARPVIYGGALLTAAASITGIAAMHPGTFATTTWVGVAAALGLGFGALSTGVSAAGALTAGVDRYAGAVGASMTARQLGGALGVALAVAIVDRPLLGGVMPGYISILAVVIALMLLAGVLGLFIRPTSTTPPARPHAPGRAAAVPAIRPAPPRGLPAANGFGAPAPAAVSSFATAAQRRTLRELYDAAADVVAAADLLLAQQPRHDGQPR